MGGKTESPHPELTALLYNSGFPLGCLSCWQPLQQMVVSARPAWSTSPLSGHVLCGAQGTNPSRLSGTAFTWPCCAHLGEGTSNSFTPFMHLAWKLLVLGHDAPRLGTLPLQDSPTCSTDHLETGKKGPPTICQDPQNNVPSRDPSMVARRKHVGQLLGLDSAHY